MISKQLIHKVITFLNTFNSNKNIVWSITIFNTNNSRIICNIQIWKLNKNDFIEYNIGSISNTIHNIKEFNNFKEQVNKELPLILKKL